MRIRFSIRDMLLATVILALAICWWLDHRRLAAKHSDYQNKLWHILDNGAGFGPWNVRNQNDFSDDNINRIYIESEEFTPNKSVPVQAPKPQTQPQDSAAR